MHFYPICSFISLMITHLTPMSATDPENNNIENAMRTHGSHHFGYIPSGNDKTKEKTYKQKYHERFAKQFPGIAASTAGPNNFYCALCKKDYVLGNTSDKIYQHVRTDKHQVMLKKAINSGKMQKILHHIAAGKGYYSNQEKDNGQQQQMESDGQKFLTHPPADVDLLLRLSSPSQQPHQHKQMSTFDGNAKISRINKPKQLLQLFPTHTPIPLRAANVRHLPLEQVIVKTAFSMPEPTKRLLQHDFYISSSNGVDEEVLPMHGLMPPPVPTSSSFSPDSGSVGLLMDDTLNSAWNNEHYWPDELESVSQIAKKRKI